MTLLFSSRHVIPKFSEVFFCTSPNTASKHCTCCSMYNMEFHNRTVTNKSWKCWLMEMNPMYKQKMENKKWDVIPEPRRQRRYLLPKFEQLCIINMTSPVMVRRGQTGFGIFAMCTSLAQYNPIRETSANLLGK